MLLWYASGAADIRGRGRLSGCDLARDRRSLALAAACVAARARRPARCRGRSRCPAARRRGVAPARPTPDAPRAGRAIRAADARRERAAARRARSTATRWPGPRWRCAARRTATAAPIPAASTAAASRSTSSRSTACRCRARSASSIGWGNRSRPEDLAPGDILFFTTTDPGPSHVAIAIGGDQFVHAPSSTGVVRVEHLSSSYWSPRYLGAAPRLRSPELAFSDQAGATCPS